ncbi:hypothetical protein [Aquamicrobium defluvii]|uniref:Uncharacterized protein n=1 Tax=Aquamicrobium defluvii TaxID=69279 RepID=A0A4R6YF10_9HYPH|nr:hypothetical protein [Aquamicrobium defluvii]TDR34840.1 hypothetical protein DES43_11252 [Aquamicrobium defluvii]
MPLFSLFQSPLRNLISGSASRHVPGCITFALAAALMLSTEVIAQQPDSAQNIQQQTVQVGPEAQQPASALGTPDATLMTEQQ